MQFQIPGTQKNTFILFSMSVCQSIFIWWILAVFGKTNGITLYHELPESESLAISLRSWEMGGVRWSKPQPSTIVAFMRRPLVVNLCQDNELSSLISGEQVIVDGKHISGFYFSLV